MHRPHHAFLPAPSQAYLRLIWFLLEARIQQSLGQSLPDLVLEEFLALGGKRILNGGKFLSHHLVKVTTLFALKRLS